MMMNRERMQEIIDDLLAENVYQAWKGWFEYNNTTMMYSHEEVITARHMLTLGIDECEICQPPTAGKPNEYVLPES